jgi:EpsI family protein
MKSVAKASVLATLMVLTSVGGVAARPKAKAAELGHSISLEGMVPRQFGNWSELPQVNSVVVNPQTQQLLDQIYSQILTRTYVDSVSGARIMLSMAYGDDQRGGGLQAHMPEVCYPAQGFKLVSNVPGTLHTRFGDIPVKRLSTNLGPRQEPVTYWFTVGDKAIKDGFDKRLVQLRLSLTGQIPDGLLFRVSSIDDNTARAFESQSRFVNDLMQTVSAKDRIRLSGLTGS